MERGKYPDITDLLAAKARRRQALAALTWEEKVAIVELMRRTNPKGMWKPRSVDGPEWQGERRDGAAASR